MKNYKPGFCKSLLKIRIISFRNPVRLAWDVIPMSLSVYNAMIIPFDFSFGLPIFFLDINYKIDIVLDVLFLLDNVLMFFTSFVNKYGIEVFDPKVIFWNYTTTIRFVFDCLSILGSYIFKGIHPSFKYF